MASGFSFAKGSCAQSADARSDLRSRKRLRTARVYEHLEWDRGLGGVGLAFITVFGIALHRCLSRFCSSCADTADCRWTIVPVEKSREIILRGRINALTWLFIVGLVVAGATAIPLKSELDLLTNIFG